MAKKRQLELKGIHSCHPSHTKKKPLQLSFLHIDNDTNKGAKRGLTNPHANFGHAFRPSSCKRRLAEKLETPNKRQKPEPPAPPEDNGRNFLVVAICNQDYAIYATNKVETSPGVSIYFCIPHCDALQIARQVRKGRKGWFQVENPEDFMISFTAASRELRGEESYHS